MRKLLAVYKALLPGKRGNVIRFSGYDNGEGVWQASKKLYFCPSGSYHPIAGHNSCQYAYNSMYMDRIKTSQPAIVDAAVLHNEQVAPRYHLLSLRLDVSSGETSWLQGVAPGQFVQVDCRPAGILLRRPISIYKWSREELCLMLLVQRVGRGSNYMCDLKVGDKVNIVGPLGTPFATDPTIAGERPLLIAGGVGMAPIIMLARHLQLLSTVRPHLIIGARTASLLILRDEIDQIGCSYSYTTDDGSYGTRGAVLAAPELELDNYSMVYTCGPRPMMRAIHNWAKKHNVPGQASLENLMACGVGACLCCVENIANQGNTCVCTDGPVFNFDQLLW